MKTQRMSLAGIKNVLSRAEMRKIMAGSGGSCYGQACGWIGGVYVSCCGSEPMCYHDLRDDSYKCM